MSNESGTQKGAGITFTGLLSIVFITLKLCGVIDWPWLWVLSPIWIPLAFIAVLFLIVGICAFITAIADEL